MLKNAATYMVGSVVAQVVTLAAVPILSRLYSPDDFGLFGIFSALLSIIGVASCLRFELVIPLPKSSRQAAQIFAMGFAALFCVSVLVLLCVLVARGFVATILSAPRLKDLLWLLPLSVLGYGTFSLLNYWSTRRGQFKFLAVSNVARSVSVGGAQIICARVPGGSFGMIFGQLIGQWVANLMLARQALKGDRAVIVSGFKMRRIRTQVARYRTFALHGAPQAILNSASQSVPAIMLGWFFNPVVVGFYLMAQRVVSAPMALISQSLRQAMLPYFSSQHRSGESLRPALIKYTIMLAALGSPALLALLFGGERIFSLVLGQEWEMSGRFAAWLALWLWAGMINPAATTALTVLERQKTLMSYEAALLVARVLGLATAMWTKSPEMTIAIFSLIGLFFNISLIGVALVHCKTSGDVRMA